MQAIAFGQPAGRFCVVAGLLFGDDSLMLCPWNGRVGNRFLGTGLPRFLYRFLGVGNLNHHLPVVPQTAVDGASLQAFPDCLGRDA